MEAMGVETMAAIGGQIMAAMRVGLVKGVREGLEVRNMRIGSAKISFFLLPE